MMTRIVLVITVALAMSCAGFCQQSPQEIAVPATASDAENTGSASVQQQLKQKIATDEAALRQAEATHAPAVERARIYWNLGLLYEDTAAFGLSETALTRSVSLFRSVAGDDAELATALNSLVILHTAVGEFHQADKDMREALQLREKLSNRLLLAESWSTFAALSLKEHKYSNARDYAAKAVAEFKANPKADEVDRIASQYALGMSLCALKDYSQGVQVLKDAVAEAMEKLPVNDFPIGSGQFFLGVAYWKAGEMAQAGREMQTGLVALNEHLGGNHPAYVASLELYAQYLHQTRQVEAANVVDRQIQQAKAVVDVRSLEAGRDALGFDAFR